MNKTTYNYYPAIKIPYISSKHTIPLVKLILGQQSIQKSLEEKQNYYTSITVKQNYRKKIPENPFHFLDKRL